MSCRLQVSAYRATATCLLLAWHVGINPTPGQAKSMEVILDAQTDDAEEDSGGGVAVNERELDLGQQQWVGLRFTGVNIPPGAFILSANIELRAFATNSESTQLTLFGEDIDHAPTFATAAGNLSNRTPTTASVAWTDVESWRRNRTYYTPDITTIVQQVVDRPGWADGNDLVILIRSDDPNGRRVAFSRDRNRNRVATLHVEFTNGAEPIGHWKLDEQTGTVANDSSGSGHHGDLNDGATWVTEAVRDGGARFAGNAHIRVPHNTNLLAPDAVSAAAWIYVEDPSGRQNVLQKGRNYALWEIRGGGTPYNVLRIGGWKKYHFTRSAAEFVGGWHHVAFTYDGSQVVNYIDGEVDSVYPQTGSIQTDSGWLGIGVNGPWNDSPFQGRIDDVRLYRGALTAAEVAELYGLLGYWKLDEGSGTVAIDSSATASDGVLQNGPTWSTDCAGDTVVVLDGTDDLIQFPASAGIRSNADLTFSGWFRLDNDFNSSSHNSQVIASAYRNGNANWHVVLAGNDYTRSAVPDGSLVFKLNGASNANRFAWTHTVNWNANTWYHFAVIGDADASNQNRVYINGTDDTGGSSGNSRYNAMDFSSSLQFGFGRAENTRSRVPFDGWLKRFRFHNRRLSAAEIAELYGYIAYWKLDETSGSVAIDSSGRGNDAEYIGSPSLGVDGANPSNTNTAVVLDGGGQHLSSGRSLLNGLEEFTIAGWFRPTDVLAVDSYFGQQGLIQVGIPSVNGHLNLWTNRGGAITAPDPMIAGAWTHIAAVGDGTSLLLYVNGELVATGGTPTSNYGSNSEPFNVGDGVVSTSNSSLDGRVDELRVYRRALCQEEIDSLHSQGRQQGVRIIRWVEAR